MLAGMGGVACILREDAAMARTGDGLAWQEAIFEGCRDAVFISNGKLQLVAVNRAAGRLTGYSKGTLLGMRISDLCDPADMAGFAQICARSGLAGAERHGGKKAYPRFD